MNTLMKLNLEAEKIARNSMDFNANMTTSVILRSAQSGVISIETAVKALEEISIYIEERKKALGYTNLYTA